jgi:glycosyltransferase involved in cell wall biosynthesis
MTRVAAVVVTHDSERWIEQTLASIADQGRPADVIVVIDDASTDRTRELVARTLGDQVRIVASTSTAADRVDRIAHNFRQGLRECLDCDVAILGDHDDLWHHNRIGHQAGVLEARSDTTMLASNGRLVDEEDQPTGGTLRDAFPIHVDLDAVDPAARMRAVLRRSVATGGASAVRPSAFANVEIPAGWLHDRWWSILATSREQLLVDDEVVIDYRVTAGQEVGLDSGHQQRSTAARAVAALTGLGRTTGRLRDLRRLAGTATPATRPELAGARLLRNLL